MLQELVNRSEDLRKLQNKGYELEVMGGYLVVHHIPYVANINGNPIPKDDGKLVAKLRLSGNNLMEPFDHTAHFVGDFPCDKDGGQLNGVVNNSTKQDLGNGLVVNHYLSNKPVDGKEKSYYEKIKRYESIISRPAQYLDNNMTAKTFKPIQPDNNASPFKYIDTMSSRYDIQTIADKLKNEKIAIVGLGGTGSYVLDFIAKTPVKEIHLFDGDYFCTHNAFRAPGASSIETLENKQLKVEYFRNVYGNMRDGIFPHPEHLTSDNIEQLLNGFDFVFLCIDNSKARKLITEFLGFRNIPFVDTGIGLCVNDDEISGLIRTTYCDANTYDDVKENFLVGTSKVDEAYKTNIQIAELNALNAAMAVIKWKQQKGVYNEQNNKSNYVFSINDWSLIKN